jgi:hypothetical protein
MPSSTRVQKSFVMSSLYSVACYEHGLGLLARVDRVVQQRESALPNTEARYGSAHVYLLFAGVGTLVKMRCA